MIHPTTSRVVQRMSLRSSLSSSPWLRARAADSPSSHLEAEMQPYHEVCGLQAVGCRLRRGSRLPMAMKLPAKIMYHSSYASPNWFEGGRNQPIHAFLDRCKRPLKKLSSHSRKCLEIQWRFCTRCFRPIGVITDLPFTATFFPDMWGPDTVVYFLKICTSVCAVRKVGVRFHHTTLNLFPLNHY